jgi:hypothetical protein
MKLARVLVRLVLLSLVAAGFVGLTALYGGSDRPSAASDPVWQNGRDHRPSAPQVGYFSEFVGEGLLLVFFAATGRIVLRLRLNPVPRYEGQPVLLDLHRSRPDSLNSSPSRAGPTPPIG